MKEKNINLKKNNSNLYSFENDFWSKNKTVCGVDEVGRGCLAGPIVTVALILNPYAFNDKIKDSKLLNSLQIENIFKWIINNSSYAVGISSPRIIDKHNIYVSTQMTMKKALFHLLQSVQKTPDIIVIDAMPISLENSCFSKIAIESWIKGESKSASIAAASIVAKHIRDGIMKKMHESFPSYAFNSHKGYGTVAHISAIKYVQDSVVHRQTFIKNFKKGSDCVFSNQQNLFC